MIKVGLNSDSKILALLAINIWVNSSLEELTKEFESFTTKDNNICLIKYDNNMPIGFAQCTLRNDYVEGSSSSPVGYLEGIYVKDEYRGRGFAKELVEACEKWAKEKGCKQFASDCELNNKESIKFHKVIGFKEANRIVCFIKKI